MLERGDGEARIEAAVEEVHCRRPHSAIRDARIGIRAADRGQQVNAGHGRGLFRQEQVAHEPVAAADFQHALALQRRDEAEHAVEIGLVVHDAVHVLAPVGATPPRRASRTVGGGDDQPVGQLRRERLRMVVGPLRPAVARKDDDIAAFLAKGLQEFGRQAGRIEEVRLAALGILQDMHGPFAVLARPLRGRQAGDLVIRELMHQTFRRCGGDGPQEQRFDFSAGLRAALNFLLHLLDGVPDQALTVIPLLRPRQIERSLALRRGEIFCRAEGDGETLIIGQHRAGGRRSRIIAGRRQRAWTFNRSAAAPLRRARGQRGDQLLRQGPRPEAGRIPFAAEFDAQGTAEARAESPRLARNRPSAVTARPARRERFQMPQLDLCGFAPPLRKRTPERLHETARPRPSSPSDRERPAPPGPPFRIRPGCTTCMRRSKWARNRRGRSAYAGGAPGLFRRFASGSRRRSPRIASGLSSSR